MMSTAPDRISMSAISSACSPVSGWETSSASVSTPSLLGVLGVEGVLGVDERRDAAALLGVGDGVEGEGGLAGGLRPVDLDDAAAREAADAEGDVEGDRPGGDHLDGRARLVAEAHDGALAELPLDLGERGLEGLLAVVGCHECPWRVVSTWSTEAPGDATTTFSTVSLGWHPASVRFVVGFISIAERLFERRFDGGFAPACSRCPDRSFAAAVKHPSRWVFTPNTTF